jgi:peptidoglycan hydrolase CwlO-like protein
MNGTSSSSLQTHFGNNDHPQNTSNNSYYDSSENGNGDQDVHQEMWNTLTKELEEKNRQIHEKNLQIQEKEKIIEEQQRELENAEKTVEQQKENIAKQNEIIKSFK